VRVDFIHAGKYSMAYVTLCKHRAIRLHSFTNARYPSGT
jgi:hypothetical protein